MLSSVNVAREPDCLLWLWVAKFCPQDFVPRWDLLCMLTYPVTRSFSLHTMAIACRHILLIFLVFINLLEKKVVCSLFLVRFS